MVDNHKAYLGRNWLNVSGVIRSRVGPEFDKAPIIMEPGDSPPRGEGEGHRLIPTKEAKRLTDRPCRAYKGGKFYCPATRVIRCGRKWLAAYLCDFALHSFQPHRS